MKTLWRLYWDFDQQEFVETLLIIRLYEDFFLVLYRYIVIFCYI